MNYTDKIKKMNEERETEKKILEAELDLSQKINKKIHQEYSRCLQELKEVKQTLKVPRLHYKFTEKQDWDEISKQF